MFVRITQHCVCVCVWSFHVPSTSERAMASKNDNNPVECVLLKLAQRVPAHCLLLNCCCVAKRGLARNVIMFDWWASSGNVTVKVVHLACIHTYRLYVQYMCTPCICLLYNTLQTLHFVHIHTYINTYMRIYFNWIHYIDIISHIYNTDIE